MKEGFHFPERRLVRTRVDLHLLALVLLPDGGDRRYRSTTNLPKDIEITHLIPSNEYPDVYWMFLRSDEFEPVRHGELIPEITITISAEIIGQECCAECGGIYSPPIDWSAEECPFCRVASIQNQDLAAEGLEATE